jgi:hypothetical protein
MIKKFEWYPSECAPELYPINIVSAKLILNNYSIVDVPSGSDMANGWGAIGRTHIVGDDNKSLPESLQVLWFSYVENEFYQGDFVLPKDSLTKLFNEGFIDPNTMKRDHYDRIVVGFAPGGYVAVWAKGGQITTEIGFFKAKSVDYDWQKFSLGLDKSREDYIASALDNALNPDQRKIAAVPFSWKGKYEDDYRKVYSLSITNTLEARVSGALISYFDGSAEYHVSETAADRWNLHQTIPQRIVWHWTSDSRKELQTEIIFDETEIMDAFKKLNSEHPHEPLAMLTEVVPATYSVSVILKNRFDSIVVKQCIISTYEQ